MCARLGGPDKVTGPSHPSDDVRAGGPRGRALSIRRSGLCLRARAAGGHRARPALRIPREALGLLGRANWWSGDRMGRTDVSLARRALAPSQRRCCWWRRITSPRPSPLKDTVEWACASGPLTGLQYVGGATLGLRAAGSSGRVDGQRQAAPPVTGVDLITGSSGSPAVLGRAEAWLAFDPDGVGLTTARRSLTPGSSPPIGVAPRPELDPAFRKRCARVDASSSTPPDARRRGRRAATRPDRTTNLAARWNTAAPRCGPDPARNCDGQAALTFADCSPDGRPHPSRSA
jgi:hypothetical protein